MGDKVTKSQRHFQSTSKSMTLDVIRGSTSKPAVSNELVKMVQSLPDANGRLIIAYPISGTFSDLKCIDALWVNPDYGVVVFDLIEGTQLGDYQTRQDAIAIQIANQLRQESRLFEQQNFVVPIHAVSFSPDLQLEKQGKEQVGNSSVTNSDSFIQYFQELPPVPVSVEDWFDLTLSNIGTVSHIRKPRASRRPDLIKNSRKEKLAKLEDTIATLDPTQHKAVLETVEGVQRIRGLAGSGKTIVLALKAAYLHAQNPDWQIGITFLTRSLKSFFRQLVRDFYYRKNGIEPEWKNLHILNAWGAPGSVSRDGIYHRFCVENGLDYMDFNKARREFGLDEAFNGACIQALDQTLTTNITQSYDVLLVDEAQDLPPSFLRLCYESLKKPKRLVYAYDELQNLSDDSVPAPEEIFGKDTNGKPKVTFGDKDPTQPTADLILDRCYRTSYPILVTAHAIGFGIYRDSEPGTSTGLVQMFDDTKLWEDVGYKIVAGQLEGGKNVTLRRTHESSPRYLANHSPPEDLMQFITFKSDEDQAKWLARSIEQNITDDDLDPSDIMVINIDPTNTRQYVGPIRALLKDMKIHSHFAGVDTSPDVFIENGVESVTFTGIHRAKGNEAAMVYIVNADYGLSFTRNLASVRNRLFTAITRSKAWVRVAGVGREMEKLEREYSKLLENDFRLSFCYPREDERRLLRTIHRDMSLGEEERLNENYQKFNEIVIAFEQGDISKEDLDPELASKLHHYLQPTSP